MRRLKRVAIVGVGLVGGSFALALRRAGAVATIVGVDRNAEALARAAALGVDRYRRRIRLRRRAGADLVVVAVPVRAIAPVLHDVALALDAGAVVTDVGSTKADVTESARAELRGLFPRFVPGHPIAGREASGVEAATADLFRAHASCSPARRYRSDAVDLVRACWEAAGGRVVQLEPRRTTASSPR
jgi:prephenate dehydrogenase